jgi:hypothetical protein
MFAARRLQCALPKLRLLPRQQRKPGIARSVRQCSSEAKPKTPLSLTQKLGIVGFGVAGFLISYAVSWMYKHRTQPKVPRRALQAAPVQAEVTEKVFMDVSIGGQPAGRVVIGLYGKNVPKTTKNFSTLSASSFKNCTFHRIIPGFMCVRLWNKQNVRHKT